MGKDEEGNIIEIRAKRVFDESVKTKGTLGWVSKSDMFNVEVRNYEHLFTTPNPDANDYEKQLNPNSMTVYKNALINKGLASRGLKAPDRFQFERLGFYTVDYDTDNEKGKIVFNLTVGLVDNAKKKAMN